MNKKGLERNSSLLHIRVHNFFYINLQNPQCWEMWFLPLDLLYCSIVFITFHIFCFKYKLKKIRVYRLWKIYINISLLQTILYKWSLKIQFRDVSAGATGATAVAPKFSDTLTLSQPGGEDSAHHRRGRS